MNMNSRFRVVLVLGVLFTLPAFSSSTLEANLPDSDVSQAANTSYLSKVKSRLFRRANSLWGRLTKKCNGGSFTKVERSGVIAVGKPASGYGGKLDYRGVAPVFSRVDCEGELSILLDPKGPEGKIRALNTDVSFDDSGDVLYLKGSRGKLPYDVVISGKKLVSQISAVNLYDACSLSGSGLSQSAWQLNSDTTGDVILKGMFERCMIVQQQNNILDMYWVGSKDVDVISRSGVLRMAGSVDHARFRFSGDSQATINHLKASNAWIYASDDAYVELFGSRRLSVFMDGDAQVQAEGVPVLSSQITAHRSMFVVDD